MRKQLTILAIAAAIASTSVFLTKVRATGGLTPAYLALYPHVDGDARPEQWQPARRRERHRPQLLDRRIQYRRAAGNVWEFCGDDDQHHPDQLARGQYLRRPAVRLDRVFGHARRDGRFWTSD